MNTYYCILMKMTIYFIIVSCDRVLGTSNTIHAQCSSDFILSSYFLPTRVGRVLLIGGGFAVCTLFFTETGPPVN